MIGSPRIRVKVEENIAAGCNIIKFTRLRGDFTFKGSITFQHFVYWGDAWSTQASITTGSSIVWNHPPIDIPFTALTVTFLNYVNQETNSNVYFKFQVNNAGVTGNTVFWTFQTKYVGKKTPTPLACAASYSTVCEDYLSAGFFKTQTFGGTVVPDFDYD